MSTEEFLQKINYQFNDPKLLEEAITHPSFNHNKKIRFNYQRLEFLGDKVLSLVISEFLINNFPDESEGDLSKRHAQLVSGATLSEIASSIEIEKILKVSKGESNLGGKNNKNNLENALEAIVGAIYLDSNFFEAKKFILNFWQEFLQKNAEPPQDPVSKLQEIVQEKSKQLPTYEIERCGGNEHEPLFQAVVRINYLDQSFEAIGKSKKEAQRNAAVLALENLQRS
jgi:ribonuclease-3